MVTKVETETAVGWQFLMPFVPVGRDDLPLEWQKVPQTAAEVAAAAREAGLDIRGLDLSRLKSSVAFSAPECKDAFEYQQMVCSIGASRALEIGSVNVAIQHPGTWADGQRLAGKPCSVAEWVQALRANGRPPNWSLVRVFYN